MRRHGIKEIKQHVCTELRCDMCNKRATHPENGIYCAWQDSDGGTKGGSIHASNHFFEADSSDELDLCYECAVAIIEKIRSGKWKLKGGTG